MPLKILLADRKLGAASKLAFLQLWDYAGRKPGRIVITADWLGSTCGRSPKAAWLWLEELAKHDLIRLGERNERRGSVTIDLYNPCPGGDREANPDRQLRLGEKYEGYEGCEGAKGAKGMKGVKARRVARRLRRRNLRALWYQ